MKDIAEGVMAFVLLIGFAFICAFLFVACTVIPIKTVDVVCKKTGLIPNKCKSKSCPVPQPRTLNKCDSKSCPIPQPRTPNKCESKSCPVPQPRRCE